MPKQQEPEQKQKDSFTSHDDSATGVGTGPESPGPLIPDSPQANLRQPTHDRRQFTVFQVDEFVFQQATTRTVHWSVPWSDLMMTMFILFLIMFVYQTAHKELLVGDETQVVGGQTTGALDVAPNNKPSLPYAPIKPGLPLITAGTIKKVEPIHIYDVDGDTRFSRDQKKNPLERIKQSLASPSPIINTIAEKQPAQKEAPSNAGTELLTDQGAVKSQPSGLEQNAARGDASTNKFLNIIAGTIASYNLDKYASVDLVSDTDVRITLTSDLLFAPGKADLTSKSTAALQKIGAAIKTTPFMIDIIGHTDNQPSHSDHFPSNWELSVARASSIARFFIDESEMNPNQFMVSGYSSYRPLYPHTTLQNRAANRRIEVIITNKHPQQALANKNQ
jgi:chemotaxis protein MotB